MQSRIDTIAQTAIQERVSPGMQLVVGCQGKLLFDKCYGSTSGNVAANSQHAPKEHVPKDQGIAKARLAMEMNLRRIESAKCPWPAYQVGPEFGPPPLNKAVEANTLYDLASLSKAICTTSLAMLLVDAGKLKLDQPAQTYIPQLRGPSKEKILIRHLLGHASGLPPHRRFYRLLRSRANYPTMSRREKIAAFTELACAEELEYEPGSKQAYSDLGFFLLGRAIENISGQSLAQAFEEKVAIPLSMKSTSFVEATTGVHKYPEQIAPTKGMSGQGYLQGVVHDDNAQAAGGICGHAGLFGNARDIGKFAQALCNAYRGVNLEGQKQPWISQECLRLFWGSSAAIGSWRLGWDSPAQEPGKSSAGESWPKNGVGHLGFTGTSLWLAPQEDCFVAIVTNRVFYSWQREGIAKLRRNLMNTISKELPL